MSQADPFDEDVADLDFPDQDEGCPSCGGEGVAEYIDHPEAWGEDSPSEENHLIICPNCGGTGFAKDARHW